ncbi:MAG: hypothetical protein HAW66_03930 [Shewanella sp.]|nr:hypothetical protein [Shewanella sp.]
MCYPLLNVPIDTHQAIDVFTSEKVIEGSQHLFTLFNSTNRMVTFRVYVINESNIFVSPARSQIIPTREEAHENQYIFSQFSTYLSRKLSHFHEGAEGKKEHVKNIIPAIESMIPQPVLPRRYVVFDPIEQSQLIAMTSKKWVTQVRLPVQDGNPMMTLILDLDKTLLSYGKQVGRMKAFYQLKHHSCKDVAFYDPIALDDISLAQHRGHRVIVMTLANYNFFDIRNLLAERNIDLEFYNYYNRNNLNPEIINAKVNAIEDLKFGAEAMFFDDKIRRPLKKVFATRVSPKWAFPKISGPIKYPATVDNWLTQAAQLSLTGNCTRLRLIITPETVVQMGIKPNGRFKNIRKLSNPNDSRVIYDEVAMKQLSKYVQNGHRIILLNTPRGLHFSDESIIELFNLFSITLKGSNFINRQQISHYNLLNSELLDYLEFDNETLFADCNEHYRPKKSHFSLVSQHKFIELL